MAFLLVRASSQCIRTTGTLSITDVPFSVGMWCRSRTADATISYLWTLSDTGSAAHFHGARINASDQLAAVSAAGGSVAGGGVTTSAAGFWTFVLLRHIGTAERRLHCFSNGLSTSALQSVSSAVGRVATGLDTISVGAMTNNTGVTESWDGQVAEYWLAQGDVYPTGVVPTAGEIRALAFGGPFAHPVVSSKLIEYRSFRQGLYSPGDVVRHTYELVNSPTLVDGPPLPYWYKRHTQTVRNNLII